jgi:hypothetical protein
VPTLPTVFVLTFLSQASQAYIDPSAGSLLWPFLISVLATAVHWLYNFRNKKHVDLRRVRGKRQVLQQLESLNLKSQVLPLLWISRVNWQQDKQKFARQVATLNSTQDLIVRSSAQGEDSELQTHAGAFDSQVLLKGSEQAKACNTIDKVFEGMHGHLHDEIFVQEYLSNVQSCGVVFSRHFHFWNYLVHSQANAPHSTAAITAGDLTDSATTVHYRPQLSELNSQSEAITDTLRIEREFGFEIADIEYAQQGHRSILFQARGLVPEDKPSYYGPLLDSHKMQQFNHNANLTLEKYGPLSCMSDWNPAEILGLVPGEFAASLFEDLIGKETWIAARESLGYQSVSDRTLTARLAGDVYIKTQLSALSLIPATVDQKLASQEIYDLAQRLRESPHEHDCLEFQLRCSQISLFGGQLGSSDEALERRLLEHAKTLLANPLASGFLSAANPLDFGDLTSRFSSCQNQALQFARAARCAFIARRWLTELSAHHPKLESQTDAVISDSSEISQLAFNNWLRNQNLNQYSTRDLSFTPSSARKTHRTPNCGTSLNQALSTAVLDCESLLMQASIRDDLDKQAVAKFIVSGLAGREFLKRTLLQQIGNYIEGFEPLLQQHSLTTEFLDDLPHLTAQKLGSSSAGDLKRQNFLNFNQRKLHSQLWKPDLFYQKDQLLCFELQSPTGYFINSTSLQGPVVYYDSREQTVPQLRDAIVVIERMEPGMDWVFAEQPRCIITRFGGPNSHLAIRCFETKTSAVLGISEQKFQALRKANKASVCGHSKKIEVLQT